MEEHLFHPRTVHHGVIFYHNGLSDIVNPNAFLANACLKKLGIPIYVFGSRLFCNEMQRIVPSTQTVDRNGMFIVELADSLDETVADLIKKYAKKLVFTTCSSNPAHLLPFLNHVDQLPPNNHVYGRIFHLEECANFIFPKTFDPDHYVSKGESYFSPTPPLQAKAFLKHPAPETLIMSYPIKGGIDSVIVRENGSYKYRNGTPRCFDPCSIHSYSGKIPAVLRNLTLDDTAVILVKDVKAIVIALEAVGYRRKGSPPLFEVAPPNGKFYAVHCSDKDWATEFRTTEEVVVASEGRAHVLNPAQIHVLEPFSMVNLSSSSLFNSATSCKLFLHAAMHEEYPPLPKQCIPLSSWKEAIHGDLAIHYVLHRQCLANAGTVTGALKVDVTEELDRLVLDRPTVRDRRQVAGYILLHGSNYLFQPDPIGHRFEFEEIMERGVDEDVAAGYVLERMEFEECAALLRRSPQSRAERAFRRYMLANCWSDPETYTFWRSDGTLQGLNEHGELVTGVPKEWTRGVARVRHGKLKLLTPQKFTTMQLQTIAESTLADETELWLKIELKLRAQGLVLTPLQI